MAAPRAAPAGAWYRWAVLALTSGLMVSDYATRSVISGVFPLLKAQWHLTDTQLGTLASIVPLLVGIGTFPIAYVADRWGRVRSVTAMAVAWCIATLGCGLSQNYGQLLVARGAIGLGEAGYGGAGGAVLAHVFPRRQHSFVYGILLAGSLVGTVVGVALGGALAQSHGWRWSFLVIGGVSLLLVIAYPMVVRDYETVALKPAGSGGKCLGLVGVLRELFSVRTAVFTWLAGGLMYISLGAFMAWIPTYAGRYYQLQAGGAAGLASIALLLVGVGLVAGGALADRIASKDSRRRLTVLAGYGQLHFVLLAGAFLLPPGPLQMGLIAAGALFSGAHGGVLIAVTAEIVHPGLTATGIATMVLANNILGLAPGPLIAGALSDAYGLKAALTVTPIACLLASFLFLLAARSYRADREKLAAAALLPAAA
jgi:predicted MFS family arabinose efflux permease